ncbi:hypothetical protein Poli38472_006936 [Pythium oligandrum]|uniref:Uncharacterized protein n=1 Tax=Pythium oligandrum TaxID=41045 RepID=A0A8K1C8T3_PYTOL|nr:hypothetical protein Poli38472_006936 [Pythium oligandrum]|eukprot:TMW58791.1 hypothetical protein Poli38472_006936 [Pythium oligandrum]
MTVKSIILPKRWLGRYNVCVHRYRLLISFAGFFCYMVAIPVPLVSPRLGIGLAVLSCVPMLFIQMLTFLGLRYDMVRLVTKSYEFWYLTVVNTVCCVLLSIYLQGGRALICIPTIGGFQCVLLIDANFRAIKHMTRISIMAATAAIALTVCTATDLLRATHDFTIVTHRNMVVKASDVIAHGFVTSAVLLLRNAYYKRRCRWLHWVITLDALSPLRREQLGIRVRTWAKVITAAGLALVSFVFVDLVAWNTQEFVNHVIARFSVRGRVIEWRVMPILLNRSVAIFFWLVRLLFRQLTYKEDDLVMLSGAVEYEDTILHRRRVRKETQERLNRMTPKLRAVNALSAMRRRSPLMHITEFSHKDT